MIIRSICFRIVKKADRLLEAVGLYGTHGLMHTWPHVCIRPSSSAPIVPPQPRAGGKPIAAAVAKQAAQSPG
jgi:hypothetical protein